MFLPRNFLWNTCGSSSGKKQRLEEKGQIRSIDHFYVEKKIGARKDCCVTIFLVNDEEKKSCRVYSKDESIDALIRVKYSLCF